VVSCIGISDRDLWARLAAFLAVQPASKPVVVADRNDGGNDDISSQNCKGEQSNELHAGRRGSAGPASARETNVWMASSEQRAGEGAAQRRRCWRQRDQVVAAGEGRTVDEEETE
jgi:hypothetical protein